MDYADADEDLMHKTGNFSLIFSISITTAFKKKLQFHDILDELNFQNKFY